MSTKSTLRHGPTHHLFKECFDQNAVYLSLDGCDFSATPNEVMVRIPLAIWEHIREATIARFELVDMSDEQLENYVRTLWQERQDRIAKSPDPWFEKFLGGFVSRGETPEAELASSLRWHTDERARQRALRDEIARLKSGEERPQS